MRGAFWSCRVLDGDPRPRALATGQRDPVDVRPVDVVVHGEPDLGDRANAPLVAAALAHPDRQRRAPVAVARQAPVHSALEPVAHAPVADVVRDPVDAGVGRQELGLARAGAHEPGVQGVVEQRRVAAPAERVGVADGALLVEQPALGEVLHDRHVGVLDEQPGELQHLGPELALEVDDVAHRDALLLAEAEVVDAVGGGGVDHAGALLDVDEVGLDHEEGGLLGDQVLEQIRIALVGSPGRSSAASRPPRAGPGEPSAAPRRGSAGCRSPRPRRGCWDGRCGP